MIRFYWQRGSIYIFLNELLKKRYLPVQKVGYSCRACSLYQFIHCSDKNRPLVTFHVKGISSFFYVQPIIWGLVYFMAVSLSNRLSQVESSGHFDQNLTNI